MKFIKNNIIKILFGILIFTSFSSCDEGGNPVIGGTTTQDFAGDWFISLKGSDGKDVAGGAYSIHHTYNTSANDNTMWIDDEKHGYWIKCKMTIDLATGTFSAASQDNANDPGSNVTITNGKIEKGAGLSKAGHKVDKITFTARFDYDPAGYTVIHTGHKRTGFKEDEY
jgi:hypothetical protein